MKKFGITLLTLLSIAPFLTGCHRYKYRTEPMDPYRGSPAEEAAKDMKRAGRHMKEAGREVKEEVKEFGREITR